MRVAVVALLLALPLGGSGDAAERGGSGAGFDLRYQRSGGFVGVSEDLRIHDLRVGPGYRATLISGYGRDGETVRFGLGERRVDSLRAAFREAGWARLRSPGSTPGCADCYLYEIAYRGRRVEFDSASFPERLGPAVRRLDAIVAAHRPRH